MKTLLATFALAASAFAGQVTQTQTVATQSFNSFPSTLTFNKFDPTGGLTLVDIKFIINGNFTDTTSNTNNTVATHTYTYTDVTRFTLTDPDGNNTNLDSPAGAPQHVSQAVGNTTTFTGTASGIANSTYNAAGALTFSNGSPAPDPTILIPTYVQLGGGTFNFNLDATDTSGVTGATPHATNSDGSAGATITVIYDYTSPSGVPEPATMMLFGSALVGIGTWKKFGKKSV